MNEDELYDKLEQYVRGKLPPEEAAALERDIAADPDLQEQLRLHRLELESHEFLLREKLRANVREWIAEPPPEPPSSFLKSWGLPFLLIAFAVVGFWYIGRQKTGTATTPIEQHQPREEKPPVSTPDRPIAKDEPEKTGPAAPGATRPNPGYLALAETNYRMPTHLAGGDQRSGDPSDTTTTPLAAGIRAFQNGRYQTAIRELNKVQETADPDEYLQAREWLAHAWFRRGLQTGDFHQAAEQFQWMVLLKNNDPAQLDRAQWYLLLSLLPDYPLHKSRADTLLQNILAVQNHMYFNEAKQVQEALRKMN